MLGIQPAQLKQDTYRAFPTLINREAKISSVLFSDQNIPCHSMPETEILLRAVEPYDIDVLYRWENDTEIWRVSNTITPFSKFILEKYIESAHLDIYQAKQL